MDNTKMDLKDVYVRIKPNNTFSKFKDKYFSNSKDLFESENKKNLAYISFFIDKAVDGYHYTDILNSVGMTNYKRNKNIFDKFEKWCDNINKLIRLEIYGSSICNAYKAWFSYYDNDLHEKDGANDNIIVDIEDFINVLNYNFDDFIKISKIFKNMEFNDEIEETDFRKIKAKYW